MDFKVRIETSLKESLKQKNTIRTSLLRMLLASIKNKEVEKMGPLNESEFYALVRSSIKQHHESIESFKRGNRLDLVEKEEKELEILNEFLPSPMTQEDISKEIEEAIKTLNVSSQKEMGKIIKFLMEKHPGRLDGKMVSEMVRKRLSSP